MVYILSSSLSRILQIEYNQRFELYLIPQRYEYRYFNAKYKPGGFHPLQIIFINLIALNILSVDTYMFVNDKREWKDKESNQFVEINETFFFNTSITSGVEKPAKKRRKEMI